MPTNHVLTMDKLYLTLRKAESTQNAPLGDLFNLEDGDIDVFQISPYDAPAEIIRGAFYCDKTKSEKTGYQVVYNVTYKEFYLGQLCCCPKSHRRQNSFPMIGLNFSNPVFTQLG